MVKKKMTNQYPLPKWFYVAAILVVVALLCVYFYLSGWATYTTSFIGCGWRKPVYAYNTLAIGGERGEPFYILPSERGYVVKPEFGIADSAYYCSAAAAQADGYQHKQGQNVK